MVEYQASGSKLSWEYGANGEERRRKHRSYPGGTGHNREAQVIPGRRRSYPGGGRCLKAGRDFMPLLGALLFHGDEILSASWAQGVSLATFFVLRK